MVQMRNGSQLDFHANMNGYLKVALTEPCTNSVAKASGPAMAGQTELSVRSPSVAIWRIETVDESSLKVDTMLPLGQ